MPRLYIVGALGAGFLLGANLNDHTKTFLDIKKFLCRDEYSLPTLKAASMVHVPNPRVGSESAATVKSRNNNLNQIMKHGFPSYENIRTFDDFVLSYDRRNRNANWVFEHLTKEKVAKIPDVNREKSQFVADEQIHVYHRATNEDFKRSGYDRGHLAAAGNHRWSQKAMDDTFHLSNISPQVGKGFNRDGWNTLESYVRHLARQHRNVYVCTGPLYLPRLENDGKLYVKYEVIGKNHVSVPTHFFKVALCETHQEQYELFSFIMPNTELPEKVDVRNYLVPIDTIERAAGFMLFEKIPKNSLKKINGRSV